MGSEPIVVHEDDREWEGWPPEQMAHRGEVQWRTLISAGTTPSRGLTLGVARLPPGGGLHEHRHEQPEVYYVLAGSGVVTVDGARRPVAPGDAVFLPGGCLHSIAPTGPDELRIAYVLAADAFADVVYDFGGGA